MERRRLTRRGRAGHTGGWQGRAGQFLQESPAWASLALLFKDARALFNISGSYVRRQRHCLLSQVSLLAGNDTVQTYLALLFKDARALFNISGSYVRTQGQCLISQVSLLAGNDRVQTSLALLFKDARALFNI